MQPNHVYAVILAGGSGTRFWPRSRHLLPKQLCKIGTSDLTMIETTLARLDGFIPPERRMIVTHKDQVAKTAEIVGERCRWILAEPEARNTACALALAAIELQKANPNSIMISLHADHEIRDVARFKQDLIDAVKSAESNWLTLVGIKPTRPETGYGYIDCGAVIGNGLRANKVNRFREKPDLHTAQEFLKAGTFLWNSGLFVWKSSVLLRELTAAVASIPQTLQKLMGDAKSFRDVNPSALAEAYGSLPKIAIDNAVLEVSKHVAVIESDCGWFDVGSWSNLSDVFGADQNGNYVSGDVLSIDCRNNTLVSDGIFVGTIGLEDMVVVALKDSVLVCPKSRAQDVKNIVEDLKKNRRTNLT